MKFAAKKGFMLFLLLVVIGLSFASLLDARVGGGQGYSGRGGGGSGGGGEGIGYLIYLIFRYPKVGIPIAIIVIVFYLRSKAKNPTPEHDYSSLKTVHRPLPMDSRSRDSRVNKLQQEDACFSLPLFLDFAQLLYTNLLQFAAKHQLDKMKVYLNQSTLEKLKKSSGDIENVRDIVVGNCSLMGINLANPGENIIDVLYESNYTVERTGGRKPVTYYEYSVWTLARKKGIVSKGPGEINRIGCTNCGAPLDDSQEGKCSYCGYQFVGGDMTWYVKAVNLFELTVKTPDISGGYAAEKGGHLPTLFQADLPGKLAAFKEKYPDFKEPGFYERVGAVFKMLQQAWTTQRWELARPVETDSIFQMHLYWINLYKKEKVRNVLKDIRVTKIEPVKIFSDAFYDSITVRIYASMIDYTETAAGSLIGGDPKRPRIFSEYWTFIRRAGVNIKEKDKEKEARIDRCPNCGNSLRIGMAGKCSHCGSKITSGEFDWVLSMIEQDESYAG